MSPINKFKRVNKGAWNWPKKKRKTKDHGCTHYHVLPPLYSFNWPSFNHVPSTKTYINLVHKLFTILWFWNSLIEIEPFFQPDSMIWTSLKAQQGKWKEDLVDNDDHWLDNKTTHVVVLFSWHPSMYLFPMLLNKIIFLPSNFAFKIKIVLLVKTQ